MYGGYTASGPASDDLVVLDTTQNIFIWSRANVSTNSPLSRFYHTAILVGDYMIVAFGRNNIYLPPPGSNEIFILYTGNKSYYKWVDEFIPSNSSNPSAPSTSSTTTPPSDSSGEINNNQSTKRNLIIGVTLSAVFALVGVLFIIRLYIKRRQSKPGVLYIAGS